MSENKKKTKTTKWKWNNNGASPSLDKRDSRLLLCARRHCWFIGLKNITEHYGRRFHFHFHRFSSVVSAVPSLKWISNVGVQWKHIANRKRSESQRIYFVDGERKTFFFLFCLCKFIFVVGKRANNFCGGCWKQPKTTKKWKVPNWITFHHRWFEENIYRALITSSFSWFVLRFGVDFSFRFSFSRHMKCAQTLFLFSKCFWWWHMFLVLLCWVYFHFSISNVFNWLSVFMSLPSCASKKGSERSKTLWQNQRPDTRQRN